MLDHDAQSYEDIAQAFAGSPVGDALIGPLIALKERHGRESRVAMSRTDQFVAVEVAGTEPEAELLCSLLRSAGIDCLPQLTNAGAGAGDGLGTVGSHEIMVRSRDAQAAREILHRGRA